MSESEPFRVGQPGTPDGPPSGDPLGLDPEQLGTDALEARRKAVETVLGGVQAAADYLIALVQDPRQETRDRRQAAQALLGFAGVDRLAGRAGPGSAGSDLLSGLDALLSPRPRSRWAASAVGRQKCQEEFCDWPVHRGVFARAIAHGHSVDAGYQDGCNFNHSMMDTCGPVPDGGSTRSDFWDSEGMAPRR